MHAMDFCDGDGSFAYVGCVVYGVYGDRQMDGRFGIAI